MVFLERVNKISARPAVLIEEESEELGSNIHTKVSLFIPLYLVNQAAKVSNDHLDCCQSQNLSQSSDSF